jgi:hypothetical protein
VRAYEVLGLKPTVVVSPSPLDDRLDADLPDFLQKPNFIGRTIGQLRTVNEVAFKRMWRTPEEERGRTRLWSAFLDVHRTMMGRMVTRVTPPPNPDWALPFWFVGISAVAEIESQFWAIECLRKRPHLRPMLLPSGVPIGDALQVLSCVTEAMSAGTDIIIDINTKVYLIPLPHPHFDAEMRLHNDAGPAITWDCREPEYFWHGVRVPPRVVLNPEQITAEEILECTNLEIRRAMIDRIGTERFLREADPMVLDRDVDLGGTRELLWVHLRLEEPLVVVRVSCPSTGRVYFLRVPPDTRSCEQGIAWTFGFDTVAEYVPSVES